MPLMLNIFPIFRAIYKVMLYNGTVYELHTMKW